MKEKINELRSQGKTYDEIANLLDCSKGTIGYYLTPDAKSRSMYRQTKNRMEKRVKYKQFLGGKCSRCGYSKCMAALHFHHKDPSAKSFEISDSIFGVGGKTETEIGEEVMKCELICANCHAEEHHLELEIKLKNGSRGRI